MNFHAVNRRTFLKTAGTAAAVSLLPSRLLWAAGEHKINKVVIRHTDKTFSDQELKEALNLSGGDDFLVEKLDQGIASIRRLFANTGKNFGFLNTRIQPKPVVCSSTGLPVASCRASASCASVRSRVVESTSDAGCGR